MKKLILGMTALALAAPAQAARITNLDHVAHVVTFTQAGGVLAEQVEAGRTVYFPRMDGRVGLQGGTPGTSRINSDALLSGTVGRMRITAIPAGPADDFVIWPGGQMHLQRRIKGLAGSN